MGGILDNAGLQAVGAADPYGQWQGYGLRNQQLRTGEQEILMNEQKLKQNEMALAEAKRLSERKQRLIPFRALTTDMPGTTDSDGTPLPNLEPVQGQFLLEALKGAKNAKGEPVIQDRGGEAYISEEDYEWGLGIIEKNAGIQTKLAELKSVAIKQKIDTANEEVLKILKKDPNADKPKIVDPQTGLEVDNPAFAEYQKAVANRDNQINYMNMVNKAAKGTLDDAKKANTITQADIEADPRIPTWAVGKTPEEFKQMQEGLEPPGGGGEKSGTQIAAEKIQAENSGMSFTEAYKIAKRETLQDFGDKRLFAESIAELPKLQKEADTSANGVKRINGMLDLVKKGVTGKGGQLRALLAGYAEMAGLSEEAMQGYSDAQLYQLMGRVMTGPMRLEIVGPGPVTEYEQKLWKELSAGGGAAKAAARSLLLHYKDIAEEKVNFYNRAIDAASTINPNTRVQFPRIRFDTEARRGESTGDLTPEQKNLRNKYGY